VALKNQFFSYFIMPTSPRILVPVLVKGSVILALSCMLAGCLSFGSERPVSNWTRAGADVNTMKRDTLDCQRFAREQNKTQENIDADIASGGSRSHAQASASDHMSENRRVELTNACMRARGYTKAK